MKKALLSLVLLAGLTLSLNGHFTWNNIARAQATAVPSCQFAGYNPNGSLINTTIVCVSPVASGGAVTTVGATATACGAAVAPSPTGGAVVVQVPVCPTASAGPGLPLSVSNGGTGVSSPNPTGTNGCTVGSFPNLLVSCPGSAGSGNPPFAVVQTGNGGNSTQSVTFSKTATSGNTLLCIVVFNTGTPSVPSGYTHIFTSSTTSSIIYASIKATASGSETSCAPGGSLTFSSVFYAEISGSHSLDQEATASVGSSATDIYSVAPPAITPSVGAMVFVVDCWSASGSVINNAAIFAPTWTLMYPTVAADTGINIWFYNQAGAGASLTPPSLIQPGVFNTSDGVAVATFSIL